MQATNPFAAVDLTIFRYMEDELSIYIVQLKEGPFRQKWALPGGLVRADETLEMAANRVYAEATGQKDAYFEQVYTFSSPDRDPRSRAISTGYMTFPQSQTKDFRANSKYLAGRWQNLASLRKLAYDHDEIVDVCVDRFKSKLNYTTIAFMLLPEIFTLGELQRLYENCLNQIFDKRNFRKKIVSLDLVEPTGKMRTGKRARPAALYRAKHKNIDIIPVFK